MPDHSSRAILITGGAGFIGSNFIRFLLKERPEWSLVNLDALTYAGCLASLEDVADDPHYSFIHGDIRDRETVLGALEGCDSVVHFAAESHVDRSILDSGPFIDTNVRGTQILLDCVREVFAGHDNTWDNFRGFLQVGTDEVYGELPLDRPDLLFTEDSPLRPGSPYSASKTAADHLVLAYHHTFNLPGVVTRCSNNFGPYQFPEKVIPLFITNLMAGKKVPLYGDGKNIRDWLHVDDHCEALLAVLERGRAGEVYNIGGNNEQSNLDLTHTILDLMGQPPNTHHTMIQPVPDRLGHDRRYAIDPRKIKHELGWTPTRSQWPEALAATIDWYKQNESWWRPLQERAALMTT